jgi:hypothetical protein
VDELGININPDNIPEDKIVWRYMALWKFIHLLKNKTLWFTRIDKFDDHLEGVVTQQERKRRYEK